MDKLLSFADLKGKTIEMITGGVGDDRLTFTTDGGTFALFHEQDCCESVSIHDICGDLADLIGTPVLSAEEISSDTDPDDYKGGHSDSYTWTFYKLATIKGSVTIRWIGESNGYYSESVSFAKV